MYSIDRAVRVTAALLLVFNTSLLAQEFEAPATGEETVPMYRWLDTHGRLHYSDTPPPDQADAIEPQEMPQLPATGVRLADDMDLNPTPDDKPPVKAKADSRCRRYHSDLNKVELYLQHTPNDRDRQRAADIREQISIECSGFALKRDYGDSRCRGHHSRLNKLEIFYRHSPNHRDRQKIADLKRQIEMEC